MNERNVKRYSVLGMALCVAYVLICIVAQIDISGNVWDYSEADYSMSGGMDNVRYMGWSLEEVDIASVILIAALAISFIIPYLAYFMRLRLDGRFSFWLIDVYNGWSRLGCLLYNLLGLSLLFALFMMIISNGDYGAVVGELTYRDGGELLYFVYIVFAAPVYWISTCIIRFFRKPGLKWLAKAQKIARDAHAGQTDKAGMPYINHPMRVMQAGQTPEEKIAGVLHDIVEDTDWTFERLLAEGFPPHIVDALRCLTKLSEDEPYDHFINRVKTNPLARAVKLNDLSDNMDIRRLPELTTTDIDRLKKYLKAYHELTAES